MKRRKLFLLIIMLFTFSQITLAPNRDASFKLEIENFIKKQIEEEVKQIEFEKFLEAVAYSESRGNPNVYNKYGYIGKYQFGYSTRKSCGYAYIRYSDFVKNPSIWSEQQQDSAMIILLSKNESHLKDIIHRYNGHIIEGDTITKSGILAAAHLAGAGGVQKYFRNGYNPKDAYGTRLQDYLLKFSGYNF